MSSSRRSGFNDQVTSTVNNRVQRASHNTPPAHIPPRHNLITNCVALLKRVPVTTSGNHIARLPFLGFGATFQFALNLTPNESSNTIDARCANSNTSQDIPLKELRVCMCVCWARWVADNNNIQECWVADSPRRKGRATIWKKKTPLSLYYGIPLYIYICPGPQLNTNNTEDGVRD